MELKIGSFNIKNLKKQSQNTSSLDKRFKEEKVKRIANIIRNEEFDIIALQEVLDEEAASLIQEHLGIHYGHCHCDSLYDTLKSNGYISKSGNALESDYGFIWNKEKVDLCAEPEVYREIENQAKKAMADFLNDTIIAIVNNDNDAEDDNRPILPCRNMFATLEEYKKQIQNILQKSLRPPLVACFRPANYWKNLRWEIRVINAHVQFGLTNMEKQEAQYQKELKESLGETFSHSCFVRNMRLREIKFLQGALYTAVNTKRFGDFRSVYTLLAGDFNLNIEHIRTLQDDNEFKIACERHKIITVQEKKSTLSKKEDSQGNFSYSNSYDHFAFDESRITGYDAEPIDLIKDSIFFIEEDPISDHVPIRINIKA